MIVVEDDRRLVERARAGEFEAFQTLVDLHERRVYALALRILGHRQDAEDAAQTAFLSALEHLKDFRGESRFGTWIMSIAANAALKILKKRKAARGTDDEGGSIPHPEYIADWREDPSASMEREELNAILTEAIGCLPENHRVVFLLRDVGGLSVAETARELGISQANVKVRLLRARLGLREILTRRFGDPARRLGRDQRHEGDERGSTPAKTIRRSYEES